MAKKTAMQLMYDELMAYEYTIPLELIIKCKELIKIENEQIVDAFNEGENNSVDYFNPENRIKESEQYYNETYGK